MDPKLLKERERFKQRAMAVPTIEKRKIQEESSPRPNKKSRPAPKPKAPSASSGLDYKALAGSSQFKFSVLAKIVKHMKTRHQDGDMHPLDIDEILDETNQLDINSKHKHWLLTEALLSNPKIEVVDGNRFRFKPKHNIRDRRGLIRLLDKNDQRGLGGILRDDVEEALPNAAKALKILGDQVIHVVRPNDKKEVLFFNDKSHAFTVDEELQKLWRSVPVEGVDETKIEEYLEKQNITTMQDMALRNIVPAQKRKGGKGRKRAFKTHNEHMGNVLQDYSEKQK